MNAVRAVLSAAFWAAAVASALIFAVAAVLIALRADASNSVVHGVIRTAGLLGMGAFSPYDGLFDFGGDWGRQKTGVANCALGAVVYLFVGGVIARVLRPSHR